MTVANIEDYSIMQSIKEKYRRPAYNYFINSVLQLVAKVIKQKNKIEIKDLHYK